MLRDLNNGSLVTIPTDNGIVAQGQVVSNRFAISPDGTRVAFVSSSPSLVRGDTNAGPDVFVRDLISGSTLLASSTSDGVPATPGTAQYWNPNFVSNTHLAFGTGNSRRACGQGIGKPWREVRAFGLGHVGVRDVGGDIEHLLTFEPTTQHRQRAWPVSASGGTVVQAQASSGVRLASPNCTLRSMGRAADAFRAENVVSTCTAMLELSLAGRDSCIVEWPKPGVPMRDESRAV